MKQLKILCDNYKSVIDSIENVTLMVITILIVTELIMDNVLF